MTDCRYCGELIGAEVDEDGETVWRHDGTGARRCDGTADDVVDTLTAIDPDYDTDDDEATCAEPGSGTIACRHGVLVVFDDGQREGRTITDGCASCLSPDDWRVRP